MVDPTHTNAVSSITSTEEESQVYIWGLTTLFAGLGSAFLYWFFTRPKNKKKKKKKKKKKTKKEQFDDVLNARTFLFYPNNKAPPNQGLEWVKKTLKKDKDGDKAHEFLRFYEVGEPKDPDFAEMEAEKHKNKDNGAATNGKESNKNTSTGASEAGIKGELESETKADKEIGNHPAKQTNKKGKGKKKGKQKGKRKRK